jgi:hypothetical protein
VPSASIASSRPWPADAGPAISPRSSPASPAAGKAPEPSNGQDSRKPVTSSRTLLRPMAAAWSVAVDGAPTQRSQASIASSTDPRADTVTSTSGWSRAIRS